MKTRSDMATTLSLDLASPTKTFVLEVHTDDPSACLADMVGASQLEPTEDAYLFQAHVGEQVFWVDQLDDRFWSFHTDMQARDAAAFLRDQIERRRDLDWMWLPSRHLRNAWPDSVSRQVRTRFEGDRFLTDDSTARDLRVQLAGRGADQLLDLIEADPRYKSAVSFDSVQITLTDQDLGSLTEGVTRKGRFAAFGDSFELHLAFVRAVVTRYRSFVELCERKAITWDSFGEGGGVVAGGPIAIKFSRTIEDLPRFVTELLAVRRPFRLWGIPEIVDGIAEVEAVDLHVGQRLRFDVGQDWLRSLSRPRRLREHRGTTGQQPTAPLRRCPVPGRCRTRRSSDRPTAHDYRPLQLRLLRPTLAQVDGRRRRPRSDRPSSGRRPQRARPLSHMSTAPA